MATTQEIKDAKIYEIAAIVRQDWERVYFGAVPYLDAMDAIENIDDAYGLEDGHDIVVYFLSNANTWRGETARAVKKELKRRCKFIA